MGRELSPIEILNIQVNGDIIADMAMVYDVGTMEEFMMANGEMIK
jgi:hypothetical protein